MSNRLVILLLSLTLLSSCGFKLRGNFEIPEQLTQVTIDGGEREFTDQLTEVLVKNGSSVVEGGAEASTISITKSEFERFVRTKDSQGLATGYSYTYIIDFHVNDKEGERLLKSSTVSQFRTQEYESGNELEVEKEEEFLKEDMVKELVLQMVRRLARI
jgi:LPS-assembly lipoprotein